MDNIIMAPPWGDSRSHLWSKSIAGTFLGISAGLINAIIVQQLSPALLATLGAITLGACIAGAIQGAFLRAYTRPAILWLALSLIGWWLALGGLQIMGVTRLAAPATTTALIWVGGMSSLPQWVILRRHIGRAWSWIGINVACWWVIGMLTRPLVPWF